jgi:hypothetical protein
MERSGDLSLERTRDAVEIHVSGRGTIAAVRRRRSGGSR